jgi:hypothetical protein
VSFDELELLDVLFLHELRNGIEVAAPAINADFKEVSRN